MIDRNARFVVTGPTGWIGRGLLSILGKEMGAEVAERVTCFASASRVEHFAGVGELEVRALDTMSGRDTQGAHVFHLAYLGGEQAALRPQEDFVRMNVAIDDTVLAALAAGPARSVFASSSGMAAQAAAGSASLYGACKLLQETRFLSLRSRSPSRVLVGRIYNVAGPYINKIGNYALGSLLTQARERGSISIAAGNPVFRSYLHVLDLAEVVLRELAGDHPMHQGAVDLCGPLVVEMQDVARAAAAFYGLPTSRIVRPVLDLATPNRYFGDSVSMQVMALRHGLPLASFEQQVADTAAFLASTSTSR